MYNRQNDLKTMKTTISHNLRRHYNTTKSRLPNFCMLLAAMIVALVSCVSRSDDTADCTGLQYSTRTLCNGIWEVDGKHGQNTQMIVMEHYVQIYELPYNDILAHLFEGKTIGNTLGDQANGIIAYRKIANSDGSTTLALAPQAWRINTSIDGEQHLVEIMFDSAENSENISWGTISRSGVFTLILHPTSFAIDGGNTQPISMKLKFTATVKTK